MKSHIHCLRAPFLLSRLHMGRLAKKKSPPLSPIEPGHTRPKASLYPMTLESGATMAGKFPPMLFMVKRKSPMHVDLTSGCETSTITLKRMANHVSAQK